jgi:acylphosphatase
VIRRRLTVHGRVQGVFFRESVRRLAEREGVAGWARNCADGTVGVVLEGEQAAVERVAGFCRLGPPHASVERVEVSDEEPEGLTGFRTR